jgi:hypothetical protein
MWTWLIVAACAIGLLSVVAAFVGNRRLGTVGSSTYGEALRRGRLVEASLRFTYQFVQAAVWVFETLVRPVTRPFRWAALRLWRAYRALWDRAVYAKDGYFSKTRAGVFLAATIAVLYVLVPLSAFVGDVFLFALTRERETIFLHNSHEIGGPASNLHSVQGCTALPCTEHNAMYYRVRPTAFNHVWSVINHGGLFYPDAVSGAVPPVISRCEVLTFGIRVKFVMRQWDLYPDLLDATCTPVNGR